jgi:hypothetical protein
MPCEPGNPSSVINALRAAAQGLTYPSDSDEPFDAFEWDAIGTPSAKDQVVAHGGKGRNIEEVPVDLFFEQLDADEDADRYRRLHQVLESLLAGLKIFRAGAGEVRVDIYLIGTTRSGSWAGLHTVSVET